MYLRATRVLRKWAIKLGVIRNLRMLVEGELITFPDVRRSNLLTKIALFGDRSYEGELLMFLREFPWSVGEFFDVGANVGLYSSVASRSICKQGFVTAVEPFPENVRYLQKFKKLNNLRFRVIGKA